MVVPKAIGGYENRFQYFSIEDGVIFGHTQYLKINLEPALEYGEIKLISKFTTAPKERSEYASLLEELVASNEHFCVGLITQNEFKNRRSDSLVSMLYRQGRWKIKHSGMKGGIA